MRKWFASLAVLGFVSAAATAQTIPVPPIGGCGQTQMIFFDDGTPETGWKVNYPTASGDCFSVDFDDLGALQTVTGVAMNAYSSTSTGIFGLKFVGVCPDNLGVSSLGKTPNLSLPYSMLGNLSGTVTITGTPGPSAGFCPPFVGYDTPDVTLPSVLGAHAVATALTGDSATWICGDQSGSKGRSYFTLNNYSTPAIAFSSNIMMRLIATYTNPLGSAYMTVNNFIDNVSFSQTATVGVTLWSTATVQPTLYLQGAFITGFPFIPAPQLIMSTGFENFAPISDQFQGTLCGPIGPPCVPSGINFDFGAFFIDNNNLKKNGNGKIALTNLVSCTITPSSKCYPCLCFGRGDDGVLDGTIWKVQNPAGSKDYFNMRVGSNIDPLTGSNCAKTVTNLEAASWDFCGTGPSWASFGIYPANTVIDSTGGTPDLANPVVLATTLSMAPSAADWSYPATVYDFNDINSSTNVALAGLTNAHNVIGWVSGDTCTWIASDTDGVDDNSSTSVSDCGSFPSTVSYFTLNGYSTPSITFPSAQWLMKIDWF
jgi:hypothetical protein